MGTEGSMSYQWVYYLTPIEVPDLTPNSLPAGRESCPAVSRHMFLCTRLAGHTGRHAAGTGERIVGVWA